MFILKQKIMKTIQINNKHYQECDVVMLSTDKSSKIWRDAITGEFKTIPYLDKRNLNQNLYILSNEEIKEDDWGYKVNFDKSVDKNQIWKFHTKPTNKQDWKKIIVTTDSSLKVKTKLTTHISIKFLPQIPQQFIEHFINEYNKGNVISKVLVEVDMIAKYERILNEDNEPSDKFCPDIDVNKNNEISILTEQKQETLEEAAKKYAEIPLNRIIDTEERYFNSNVRDYDSFIAGANWQAERSYTREEVIEFGNKVREYCKNLHKQDNNHRVFYEWDNWIKENLK
jgi:hypothetical protein